MIRTLYQDNKSKEPDKGLKRGKRQKTVSRKLPARPDLSKRVARGPWKDTKWFLGPEAEHKLRQRGKLRGSVSSLQPKLEGFSNHTLVLSEKTPSPSDYPNQKPKHLLSSRCSHARTQDALDVLLVHLSPVLPLHRSRFPWAVFIFQDFCSSLHTGCLNQILQSFGPDLTEVVNVNSQEAQFLFSFPDTSKRFPVVIGLPSLK